MKRKTFLKKAVVAGLAAPLVTQSCVNPSGGVSQGANVNFNTTYRWNMVTTWPPNFPVLGEGCQLFANWVKEMSGGRMEIKVYGAGELIPALECFDAVSSGTADMASGAAYYWAGKSSAAQFFSSVPFGMNAQQVNGWIMSGGGMALWKELYAQFNLVPFVGGNTGVQMGGWFNRAINSIADFKGLKMRIPGLGGKVLERAGGAAVLSAGGEIYTNLERGIIDATEWIGPSHDLTMGFHKIAKYYYTPGWHEAGTAFEMMVNKLKYDSLPKDLQLIIEAATFKLNQWTFLEFETRNAAALQKLMTEESQVEIRQFPQEVLDILRSYTEEIIEEMTAADVFTKKVYDSYKKYKTQAKAWAEITEKVYYNSLM